MTGFQTFIRRKTFLTVSACVAIGFSAPHAFAGFEWIPQKKSAASKPKMAETAPVIEVQQSDNDLFLPLPSESDLDEPVANVAPASEPMVSPTQEPIMMAPPVRETAAPTRISVMPKEEPNSGAMAMKPAEKVLPPLEPMSEEELADDLQALKKPPFEMRKTRVVMPDDAPASARETTERENIIIAPIPSEAALEATQETAPDFVDFSDPVQNDNAYPDAVGFAKDVPLALALRQIVPADYAFSFGQNVNPGLRVSWNGGKAWNVVIADMLAPLGYSARISQKAVHIAHSEPDTMLAPNVPTTPYKLEPAAGTEQHTAAPQPVSRERNIKRVNIVDPGAENIEKPTLIEKVTNIFDTPKEESDVTEVIISDETQVASISAPAAPKITFWTAQAGASLKDTLAQWSASSDAELIWDAEHDYQLSSDFEAQGSFEKAVSLLIKHGVDAQNDTLDHSYVATSSDEKIKILITDKA